MIADSCVAADIATAFYSPAGAVIGCEGGTLVPGDCVQTLPNCFSAKKNASGEYTCERCNAGYSLWNSLCQPNIPEARLNCREQADEDSCRVCEENYFVQDLPIQNKCVLTNSNCLVFNSL